MTEENNGLSKKYCVLFNRLIAAALAPCALFKFRAPATPLHGPGAYRPFARMTIVWLLMKQSNFIKVSTPFRLSMLTPRHRKNNSVSLQFCAVIRFNKSRIKSSVRASERRPPSQANAVTTLASQSLNVCKYCNKQQGFPHKRCSSSTGTDRRYGPWLQDEELCLALSFPLFPVGFPRRLPISDADKAVLLCWRSVSAHQTHLAFIRSPLLFPLIPARESLSDGLISCSNATFITARSILCFHYVGSAVIPWPFRNVCS